MSAILVKSEEECMINFVNSFLKLNNLYLVPFLFLNNGINKIVNFVMSKDEGFSYTYSPICVGEGTSQILCSYEHLIPLLCKNEEGRNFFPKFTNLFLGLAKYHNQEIFSSVNLDIIFKVDRYYNKIPIITTKNFNFTLNLWNHELIEYPEFIFHTGLKFKYGFLKRNYEVKVVLSKKILKNIPLSNFWTVKNSRDNLLEKYPNVLILETETQISEFITMISKNTDIKKIKGYKLIKCKTPERKLLLNFPIWLLNLIIKG
jgi:hypothetical protein